METPNFDLGIEELLEAKIAYHKEQMKFHAKMAAETKENLRLLQVSAADKERDLGKSHLETAIKVLESTMVNPISSTLKPINSSILSAPNTSSLLPNWGTLRSEFSVTTWKPKVEKVLKESRKPMKTEEILREIAPTYLTNEELRKKAIGVISSSLFSLVQGGKVKKLENEGRKGYLYVIAE